MHIKFKSSVFQSGVILFFVGCLFSVITGLSQKVAPPIMGWSSWNNFQINIDEDMIKEQADAMISSGLYDAGYRFINVDDGFFEGRDSSGQLLENRQKFPAGMRKLVDYIHSKGLKAGTYSDAGKNTCGSMWNDDKHGVGVGLYGHVTEDCNTYFNDWDFDFIKVDWCGGKVQKLDEETAYTKIINAVKSIDKDILVNVCRWEFPGKWVLHLADSWRISGDIRAKFSSIIHIIDLNADLYKYASPGHYNDMDMLQVGRGMSYDEDKSHFSMWCMLNSPLLAGNDLRSMSQQTIEILTNKEVIALDQDRGFKQARRIYQKDSLEIWLKPLGEKSDQQAIAVLNRGEQTASFELTPELAKIQKDAKLRDLWLHKNVGEMGNSLPLKIPGHGIVVLKTY